MGWLVGSWMGASAGLCWACATIAAWSWVNLSLRAASSSWWDLDSSEVLLDLLLVSTRVGTVGSWCLWMLRAAERAAFSADTWFNWSSFAAS